MSPCSRCIPRPRDPRSLSLTFGQYSQILRHPLSLRYPRHLLVHLHLRHGHQRKTVRRSYLRVSNAACPSFGGSEGEVDVARLSTFLFPDQFCMLLVSFCFFYEVIMICIFAFCFLTIFGK